MPTRLQELLDTQPVIVADGGMGTMLMARGHPCRDPREAFLVVRRLKDAWR